MAMFHRLVELALMSCLSVVCAASSDFMQAPVAGTHTCRSNVHIATTPFPLPNSPDISTWVNQGPPVSSNTGLEAQSTSTLTVVLTSTLVTPAPTGRPVVPNADYMEVVNKWRAKMGMKPLGYKRQLELNAMDTVMASKGAMVHKLNAGTFAQVLAPGDTAHFEYVFVGGWLCEKPEIPGLDDVCQRESNGWDYRGQTGHAEILTSKDYSKIGCAHFTGIWCCDLA